MSVGNRVRSRVRTIGNRIGARRRDVAIWWQSDAGGDEYTCADVEEALTREALSKWGYIMGLRFGVEWLRHAVVRFDAFVQADIPFFETASNESYLMEAYTPSVRAGVGVSF